MKKSILVAALAVSAFASVSAFADAGDRVDQVFPQTSAVQVAPVQTPVVSGDSYLPANFVNVYFGN